MSTTKLVLISGAALFILGIIFIAGLFFWGVGISNQEITLRTQIEAKQTSNKNQFDSMWKSQMQAFQVTEAQKQMLYDVVVGNAKARSGNGGGSLATSVKESVPNVDKNTELYQNLMNTITSLRATWTRKQDELIDYKREHDMLIDKFPSSIVCSILGRKKIDIIVVTSNRTDDAFKSCKDNNISLKGN